MSSLARKLPPPLREGDRLTRDEFLRRWEAMPEVFWAELVDGVVHMPSPVSNAHGVFQLNLGLWLGLYAAATPGCQAATAGTWIMLADSAPQPDLALRILPEYGGQSRMDGPYPSGAPELAIEISHTTTARDTGIKRSLYERAGVREYLIVQPTARTVLWLELVDNAYTERVPEGDGNLRSRVFPGLWLDPAALWDGDLNRLQALAQSGIRSAEHAAFVRALHESSTR
jgi:Uma2 family endonuclease